MAKDPVCDTQVDPDTAARQGLASEYDGVTYHFCGEHCKREFDRYPAIYIGRAEERDHPDSDDPTEGERGTADGR